MNLVPELHEKSRPEGRVDLTALEDQLDEFRSRFLGDLVEGSPVQVFVGLVGLGFQFPGRIVDWLAVLEAVCDLSCPIHQPGHLGYLDFAGLG